MMLRSIRALSLAVLLAFLGTLLIVGCGSEEESRGDGSTSKAAAFEVETPLRSLARNPQGIITALSEDGRRVVMLETSGDFEGEGVPGVVTFSETLDGVAGENIANGWGRTPENIYIPIPERDEVVAYENNDLLEVDSFPAGNSPSRVAVLGGERGFVFALSGDGSTISVVGLSGPKEVFEEIEVDGAAEFIEIASGDAESGLWVAGGDFVALYDASSLELEARMPINADTLAAGGANRAYVGEGERVVAVEDTNGGLEAVADADIGGSAEYLAAGGDLVYAATPSELVVLDAETLETVETVSFERSLERESLEGAGLSGLAVGERYVYIGLEGEPYVVLIEKP